MALAAELYFKGTMTAKDREQQAHVETVLRMVERTLGAQKAVRDGVRQGRIRVDRMMADALDHSPQPAAHQETGKG